MTIPQIHQGRVAREIYEAAAARGNVLPNFPIYALEGEAGDRIRELGVDVTDDSMDILAQEANLETDDAGKPVFGALTKDDTTAVKKYFQLRHANPAFEYDMQQNEVKLVFPLYGKPNEYCAIFLPLDDVGRLMMEETNYLDKASDALRRDPKQKTYQGIPRALVIDALEQSVYAEQKLHTETNWEPPAIEGFRSNFGIFGSDDTRAELTSVASDSYLADIKQFGLEPEGVSHKGLRNLLGLRNN